MTPLLLSKLCIDYEGVCICACGFGVLACALCCRECVLGAPGIAAAREMDTDRAIKSLQPCA